MPLLPLIRMLYFHIGIQDAGVTFQLGEMEYTFNGTFTLIPGDNLASQYLGGYKALASALRKCRHCMAVDEDMQTEVSITCCCCCTVIRTLHVFLSSLCLKLSCQELGKHTLHNALHSKALYMTITLQLLVFTGILSSIRLGISMLQKDLFLTLCMTFWRVLCH